MSVQKKFIIIVKILLDKQSIMHYHSKCKFHYEED